MPVYVYKNLTTGETFEVQQRITESAWTEHPATGDPVKRLVQPVGIAFRGSGFYATDSRNTSKGPASAKAGASDESAKSDAPTKGDASTSASDGSASKTESATPSSTKDTKAKDTTKTTTKSS